jgi:hypothetical protein
MSSEIRADQMTSRCTDASRSSHWTRGLAGDSRKGLPSDWNLEVNSFVLSGLAAGAFRMRHAIVEAVAREMQ